MNKCYKRLNIVFLLILLISPLSLNAQGAKAKEANKVFMRIEEGIGTNSVDKFSSYFSSRSYLSLSSGTAGYYSANQSFYVIKDFFSINLPLSFRLTNIVSETSTPFAAGTLRYINKGIRNSATVFISLQWIDSQWKISQITIN